MKKITFLLFGLLFSYLAVAQSFVHPGGLHTQEDLDRMKTKVAEGASPWIEGWNKMIQDSRAQSSYQPAPRANMGDSRQRAAQDAQAAYLNALRWYISGDTTHAECAVNILNSWSSTVNQVPSGVDQPGLSGIYTFHFAVAAEVLRAYPGWAQSDLDQFKNMMTTYLYPVVDDFLTNHRGTCITHYWANWDICNIGALIAMGVFVDDTTIYNEGIDYFKNGAGNGNINSSVFFLHPSGLGQWQESGRDQPHTSLGVGMMAELCQIAWNQGEDLFGYNNNRLLAGAEYVARTNLSQPVPYEFYDNCDNVNQYWLSRNNIGRITRPVWEILYNHYMVRQGLSAPNVESMAHLARPERGNGDHLGFGTLTFTLDATASPIKPNSIAPTPKGVKATAGESRVYLEWDMPAETSMQGYTVKRATNSGGPYATIASWNNNTTPRYTDRDVTNGTTYYYVVAANNKSGTSSNSAQVSATPQTGTSTLPQGWVTVDISDGNIPFTVSASATYTPANETFIIKGAGDQIGDQTDALGFTYREITGDATIIARHTDVGNIVKMGVMIRESLDESAKTAFVKKGDTGWRIGGFGARTTTGGSMGYTDGNRYTWNNTWFRLDRVGDTFTGYQSADGVEWHEVNSVTMSMDSTYYIGLASCSGEYDQLSEVTFDNVTITDPSNLIAPNAPTGLDAKGGNTQDTLSWNSVAGARSYTVKRATTSGGPYNVVASGLNNTTFVDTGLDNGTTYYYVVTASGFGGEGSNSTEINATPELSVPSAPNNLFATALSGQQIDLAWSASPTAETYQVKRASLIGEPYTTIGSPSTTFFSDTNVSSSETYYYVVTAGNSLGESPNSEEISITPGRLGYLKFDESSGTVAVDSWSNNHGTVHSGASWTSGRVNNGIHLDGSSEGYVDLPNGLMSTTNDFTIATWVKLEAVSTWSRIFDFGSENNNSMFLVPQTSTSGEGIRFAIKTTSGYPQLSYNYTWSLDTWTHIAVTLSGDTATMYINGDPVASNTGFTKRPSDLGNTPNNFIGRGQKTDDPMLQGAIDEFMIYARALSASEISNMANNPVSPATPTVLSITGKNDQVSLTWAAVSGATSYDVKRAVASGGPYKSIATLSDTTFSDTNLSNDEVHYYVVSAVNEYGGSENSSEVKSSVSGKMNYWKFDETSGALAVDSWANDDGTLHSGASWISGKVNNGIQLDGSSAGYVDFPDGLMSTINDFTIATWVKLDTVLTWARIFDFGTENSNSMFLVPQTSTSGEGTRFAIKTTSGYPKLSYNYTWPLDTWTHIAVTLSGDTATMYINGNVVASSTDFTKRPSDLGITNNNYLGNGQNSDPMLQGAIDEFRIYNRALSASEIAAITNETNETYYNIINRGSNKCIRVENGSSADSTNIIQETCNSGNWSQQFSLKDLGNGYYHIKARSSNKCLRDVGGNIVQYTCDDEWWSEQFQLISQGSFFQLSNRNTGNCIQVVDGSSSDGANIESATCNSNWWRQQFSLVPIDNSAARIMGSASSEPEGTFSTESPLESVLNNSPENHIDDTSFRIYPNPVSSILKIDLPKGFEEAEAKIFDLNGKLVVSAWVEEEKAEIDVSHLKQGVYLLQISNNFLIVSAKFVKSNE